MKRTRLAIERLESRALLSGIPDLVHVQSRDSSSTFYPRYGDFHRFTAVDDILYYVSGSYVPAGSPIEFTWTLWANDGTPGGRRGVLYGPQGSFNAEEPDWLAAAGNKLFFASKIYPSYLGVSYGLWVSNGSEEGTDLVHEVAEPEGNLPPKWPTEFDGRLFFVSETREHGHELWVSDGTPEGTSMLKDIATGVDSSDPSHLLVFDGNLFFMADDGGGTKEIWQSDGTPENTSPIEETYDASEIRNRMASLEPYPARKSSIVLGDKHFTSSGDCIWVEPVDGNTGEEPEEAPVRLIASKYGPEILGSAGDNMFVMYAEPGNQTLSPSYWILHAVNGDQVTRMHRGFGETHPESVMSVNDKFFFSMWDITFSNPTGYELWVSDGTEAGTHIVKDINPGRDDSNPRYLTNIDGLLYFVADDPDGPGLWRTDGTTDGTVRVDDPAYASSLHSAGREVYFVADTRDPTVGRELYTSLNPDLEDEYPGYGGFLIKDIRPGIIGSNPSDFMFVPEGDRIIDGVPHFGTLYFTADDGTNGRQLWKSDWTEEGTIRLSQDQFRLSEVRIGNRVYSTDSCAVWLTDLAGAINDQPVIDVPADATITTGTGIQLRGFQVSDPDFIGSDVDTVAIQVSLSTDHGRLAIDGTGLSTVSGNHTSNLLIDGTLNAVNQALSTLQYTRDPSFIGMDTITAEVNDLGHFGEGGPRAAQSQMTIWVVRQRLDGDTDFDGEVDMNDFNRLKSHFGTNSGTWNQGDFNGDNRVDLHDFNLLKSNFSSAEAAFALAVDEVLEEAAR